MASRSIPHKLKQQIWAMPCAVCGVPFGSHVDHIVPFSKGGLNIPENLQPLCEPCNLFKGNRRDNKAIRQRVLQKGLKYFLTATYYYDTRWFNDYDGISYYEWERTRLERVRYAQDLFEAFVRGGSNA